MTSVILKTDIIEQMLPFIDLGQFLIDPSHLRWRTLNALIYVFAGDHVAS